MFSSKFASRKMVVCSVLIGTLVLLVGLAGFAQPLAGPLVGFEKFSVDVQENAGSVTVNVTLSPAADSVVTVQYDTAPGSATSPTNFIAQSGTLTFPAGTTSQSITVQIVDDGVVTATQQFTIVLSNVQGGGAGL